MTRRFCEDFVQRLNLHAEDPLRPRLSKEDREKIINLEYLARKKMVLANIRERIRSNLHAEEPLRPRFCEERKDYLDFDNLEFLAKKTMHREPIRDGFKGDHDGLFPSVTTVKLLTPDDHQQLRDKKRKLLEAQEEVLDKLFEEEDQDKREILDASFRNLYTTYKALAQLGADAYSVI